MSRCSTGSSPRAEEGRLGFDEIDGIAAAAGPGLIGGVIVGLTTAKAIALVPASRSSPSTISKATRSPRGSPTASAFPICLSSSPAAHPARRRARASATTSALGTTLDDAIGEAFDKAAKLLGSAIPAARRSSARRPRRSRRFALPRPMLGRPEPISRCRAEDRAPASRPRRSRRSAGPRRRRSLRELPGRGRRRRRRPDARGAARFRETRRPSDRARGRRRRRRQPERCARRSSARGGGGPAARRAAARAVRRQWRHDRLGRAGAAARSASSTTDLAPGPRPLAARRHRDAPTAIGAGAWSRLHRFPLRPKLARRRLRSFGDGASTSRHHWRGAWGTVRLSCASRRPTLRSGSTSRKRSPTSHPLQAYRPRRPRSALGPRSAGAKRAAIGCLRATSAPDALRPRRRHRLAPRPGS